MACQVVDALQEAAYLAISMYEHVLGPTDLRRHMWSSRKVPGPTVNSSDSLIMCILINLREFFVRLMGIVHWGRAYAFNFLYICTSKVSHMSLERAKGDFHVPDRQTTSAWLANLNSSYVKTPSYTESFSARCTCRSDANGECSRKRSNLDLTRGNSFRWDDESFVSQYG